MSASESPDDSDVSTPGPVTERVLPEQPGTATPDGIDGPFFREIAKRKEEGRDAKCLVTADHGATGVGKSNLCDFLGYVCDTTPEGFDRHKVAIEPMEFIGLYSTLGPGSSAVMEEGEQFDSRRSNSNKNVEATHKWQQARVREIIAFVNLPDPSMIDRRFEQLCDYWINVERRGKCRIYKKQTHRTKRTIYYKTVQTLEWPNMDGSATFRHMDSLKGDLLDGELNNDKLVRESELEERVRIAEKKAKQDVRNRILTCLYRETEMTAGDVSALSCVDVQASRIRQIANDQG